MRTEAVTQTMQVCLGEQAIPVGTLTYSRQGTRENTLFIYDDAWLEDDNRFEISPDLPLTRERYFHKAATRSDSVFHFAIADTGRMVGGAKLLRAIMPNGVKPVRQARARPSLKWITCWGRTI